MAKNDFKPFATGAGANVMSQADWEALPALLSGFTAGKASSAQVNKAIRQAAFIAAALAQYTANKSGLDVLDDGDVSGFIAKMTTALGKDFQALDATLTALAGLSTDTDKLPYFTGTDTASLTALTSVGRNIIGKSAVADVLTYLGLPGAIPGCFLRRRFITSSSTYTPGADVKMIRVRVIGGGGGGGAAGATNSGYTAIGGGGGAGGYSEKTISITSGFSPVSITIGSGGIPGGQSGYSGGAGGVTSFGSYCSASGGDGGAGTAATNNASYIMSGGAGGLGSNGEVNAYGQSGAAAIMPPVNGGISGAGGTSIMSSGPGGRVGNASGNDGVYGSGASGGISQVAASTQYGGRGGAGIVIIEEFS